MNYRDIKRIAFYIELQNGNVHQVACSKSMKLQALQLIAQYFPNGLPLIDNPEEFKFKDET